MKQLYVFDDDLWQSINKEAITKTAGQLREVGLWSLPHAGPVWLRAHIGVFKEWTIGNRESAREDSYAEIRVDSLIDPTNDHSYVVRRIRFSDREEERAMARRRLAEAQKTDLSKWRYPPVTSDEIAKAQSTIRWMKQVEETEQKNLRYYINREGIVKYHTKGNWLVGNSAYKESGEVEGSSILDDESARVSALLADVLVVVLACKGTKLSLARGPMSAAAPMQGDREIVTQVALDVGPRIDHGGTHNSPIAHMRAGHLHTFRTGPGRDGVIQKFIGPIFVNASAEFKSTRLAYEVKSPENMLDT